MRKLIVLQVLVVACSRSESALPVASRTASVTEPVAATAAPSRMIVRTATIRIIVDDTSKAVDAVTKSVEAMGGYVSGSQVWREGELLRARLTLRVPNEKLTPALASIRGVARRVDNETMSSEDVTQEFVDLQSQVRNLEATEVELRELLTAVRKNARKAGEVLEVHKQLTAIRGEIEQAKGRLRGMAAARHDQGCQPRARGSAALHRHRGDLDRDLRRASRRHARARGGGDGEGVSSDA
ncbi:MAG TPA: DUF4349 domain-containing protein [Vicinamibacterales bacterium]|nr:DUF4349 domain-containing protein [Vicinamibacterales bacterium]